MNLKTKFHISILKKKETTKFFFLALINIKNVYNIMIMFIHSHNHPNHNNQLDMKWIHLNFLDINHKIEQLQFSVKQQQIKNNQNTSSQQ